MGDAIRRRARYSVPGSSNTSGSSSSRSDIKLSITSEDQLHEYNRRQACEQLCSQEDLYARRFQSLDRALRPSEAANNNTTGKLLAIFEQVVEEEEEEGEASSEGSRSSGMWEDPTEESTLDDGSCFECEALREETEVPNREEPSAGRSVSKDEDPSSLERETTQIGSTSAEHNFHDSQGSGFLTTTGRKASSQSLSSSETPYTR